jgi:magnesium-transporting ATPase (P-type)
MIDEMNADGDGTALVVKLGDASMVAPFTANHSSVRPVIDIIRQGRSTLVTTLQMFKILGLNCLATAYILSVMYLDGVKLGDMQVGLFHFGCIFHFYSWLLCVKVFQYWPAVFSYMHAFVTDSIFTFCYSVFFMMQATISGLFAATFFLFISHARPLHTLSAQ